MPNPLLSVQLVPPKQQGDAPTLSRAAIADFKKTAAALTAQAKPADVPEVEEEKAPEIMQPSLTEAEITALGQFRLLMDADKLSIAASARDIEDLRRRMHRNTQLEKRVSPIRLEDLLIRDFVEQEVPITPEYVLKFRTISSEVEIDAAEVARKHAATLGEEGKNPATGTFILQVATLACGLVSVSGGRMYAHSIHDQPTQAKRQEAIQEALAQLLKKSPQILQDMFDHQSMFVIRIRNIFGHAGYVEQEAGKS